MRLGFRGLVGIGRGCFGLGGDALQRNANLVTDADDALRLFVGVFVKLGIFRALDQDANLVVVHLAELVQVQAGDDAHLFVHVALGVQGDLPALGSPTSTILQPRQPGEHRLAVHPVVHAVGHEVAEALKLELLVRLGGRQ